MKGTLVGFEPVKYVSTKTGQEVEGLKLYLTVNSADVVGKKVKEEFISKQANGVYKQIEQYFNGDVDKLIGAKLDIDYNVERRGNNTYTSITDIDIELVGD